MQANTALFWLHCSAFPLLETYLVKLAMFCYRTNFICAHIHVIMSGKNDITLTLSKVLSDVCTMVFNA
jgi:hypothetical protein